MNQGFQQAIERAGSRSKLAQLLGISHQAVNKWTVVPTRHIIEIERLTGVHRSLLRPDLYEEPGQKINF
jgi:DNA-binding transcriptional regulator YdaS (Cro superfamily)